MKSIASELSIANRDSSDSWNNMM